MRGSKETTSLQSINGACPNVLEAYALRQFMISNKLGNYRGKSKGEMCNMIVERKKNENLDQMTAHMRHLMYFLHWLCPKEWTSSTSSIAKPGDGKYSMATTSHSMHIVEPSTTYFFTTIVF